MYVTYIYPWWIGEWPAYTQNNGVHFHFMKIPYVMDLILIDVINVSYMFYRSYLLQILPEFSKWIVKWKENWKKLLILINGGWAGYMAGGCDEAKIFYHKL